jgi:hypothetical protein
VIFILTGYGIKKLKQQSEENDESIITTVLAEPSYRSSRTFVDAPLVTVSNEERPLSLNQRDSVEQPGYAHSPSPYTKL